MFAKKPKNQIATFKLRKGMYVGAVATLKRKEKCMIL